MRSIHVFFAGTFGTDVARQIKLRNPGASSTALSEQAPELPAVFPSSDLYVLATWHALPSLFRQMDDICREQKTPWVPILFDHPIVRVGPVIDSAQGEGACFRCFEQRFLQHAPMAPYIQAVHDYYTQHPSAGPRGTLQAFAGWAAALLMRALNQAEKTGSLPAGSLWQMNVVSREMMQSRALGIHGCVHCGRYHPEEGRLALDLQRLLDETDEEVIPR